MGGKLGHGAAAGEAADEKELPTKRAYSAFYGQPCDSLGLPFLRGRECSGVLDCCCFLSFSFLFSWLIGFIFIC